MNVLRGRVCRTFLFLLFILPFCGCGRLWNNIKTPLGTIPSANLSSTATPLNSVGVGLDSNVQRVAIDSSGRMVVVGQFLHYNGISEPYIARLHNDGSLDTSFAPTGSGLNGEVVSVAFDSSGKIIVAGQFTSYNGISEPYVARLNTDGSLDGTFAPTGTGLNDIVQQMVLDSSGRILVAGNFSNYNGTARQSIARLLTTGALDTTFAPVGGGLDNSAYCVAVDSIGRILVGGLFGSYSGTSEPHVARLLSTGALDTTFASVGTGLNSQPGSIAVDSSGRIVVGGAFTSYNGVSEPYIARLLSTGALDTTFAPTGTGLNNMPEGFIFDSSGNIIVGGTFTSYNGTPTPYIVRLLPTGALDTTFATVGTGFSALSFGLALEPNGEIDVGGGFSNYNGNYEPFLARLKTDGTLDH